MFPVSEKEFILGTMGAKETRLILSSTYWLDGRMIGAKIPAGETLPAEFYLSDSLKKTCLWCGGTTGFQCSLCCANCAYEWNETQKIRIDYKGE